MKNIFNKSCPNSDLPSIHYRDSFRPQLSIILRSPPHYRHRHHFSRWFFDTLPPHTESSALTQPNPRISPPTAYVHQLLLSPCVGLMHLPCLRPWQLVQTSICFRCCTQFFVRVPNMPSNIFSHLQKYVFPVQTTPISLRVYLQTMGDTDSVSFTKVSVIPCENIWVGSFKMWFHDQGFQDRLITQLDDVPTTKLVK